MPISFSMSARIGFQNVSRLVEFSVARTEKFSTSGASPAVSARSEQALKAGKVVYDGPAQDLTRKQLIDIYGPEFEDVFWEGAPQ